MKRMILCAAVIAIATCGLANEQDVGVTVEGSVLIKDQAYTQILNGRTIANQPSWNPMTEKCPFDPSKAVQLAAKKLKLAVTRLKLSSVSVEKVPAMKDKWYYMVNFFQNPDSMEGDYANIIVCFDGTIPKIQKEE